MKINCIIVDDEPASRDVLIKFIADVDYLILVKECKNAIEANEAIKTDDIQLIFLDINMPKISGLQFYKSLTHPPMVIFTTAYPEYAIEGFDVNALDYLLKPFSFERFLKAVNKAVDAQGKKAHSTSNTIFLKADKKLYRIQIDEIVYLEALGDYVKVLFGKQSIMIHNTFQNLLQQLADTNIVRIHKSYAISLDKFQYIEGNQIIIQGKALPIGKFYRADLLRKIARNV